MKQFVTLAAVVLGLATASVFAESKEVTLHGTGTCAKCDLKTADKCQNVLQVKDGDKTVTYQLTGDVSKAFHKNVCQGSAKVVATGVVSEKDGKKELAATKLEVEK